MTQAKTIAQQVGSTAKKGATMKTKKEIEEMRERKRQQLIRLAVTHACLQAGNASLDEQKNQAIKVDRAAIELAAIEWVLGINTSAMAAATGYSGADMDREEAQCSPTK